MLTRFPKYEFWIIEHPSYGVLKKWEKFNDYPVFSYTILRHQGIQYISLKDAERALQRVRSVRKVGTAKARILHFCKDQHNRWGYKILCPS